MQDTIMDIPIETYAQEAKGDDMTKSNLPPRPSAKGLARHVPPTGVRRLLARAYMTRWIVIPATLITASVGAGIYFNHLQVPNASAPQVANAEPVTETAQNGASGMPSVSLAELAKPATPEPGVGAKPVALPIPVTTADKPAQEALSDLNELSSVDIGDLMSAVDNLGLRVAEAEKKLPPPAQEDDIEVPTSEADSADNTQLETSDDIVTEPEVSDADRDLFDRLKRNVVNARAGGDQKRLHAAQAELDMFKATVEAVIEFRVVDRKDEKAGFWRMPAGSPADRQFYLVVEAVVDGEIVNWAIKDADSGRIVSARKFGLKVDEETFTRFSVDKKEDGRIGNGIVGIKPKGRITPVWSLKTDGQTITEIGK